MFIVSTESLTHSYSLPLMFYVNTPGDMNHWPTACDFKQSIGRRKKLNVGILGRKCSQEDAKGCHGHQQTDATVRQTVPARAKQACSAVN